jgi:hypothetical protein
MPWAEAVDGNIGVIATASIASKAVVCLRIEIFSLNESAILRRLLDRSQIDQMMECLHCVDRFNRSVSRFFMQSGPVTCTVETHPGDRPAPSGSAD